MDGNGDGLLANVEGQVVLSPIDLLPTMVFIVELDRLCQSIH